jgi:transcriptional regulator with XRE-family HTH domain
MRLKELRKAKKLKQIDIAEMLSCSQGVYSRYESGEREPPFDIMKKLAEIYGVTVDYLMGGALPETTTTTAQVPAQEKAPSTIDEQIMRELEGADVELVREVLNFIRFRKRGGN